MSRFGRLVTGCFAAALSLAVASCGGGGSQKTPPPPGTVTMTVSSTNPASGVSIGYTVGGSNVIQTGTTSFTISGDAGTQVVLGAPSTANGNNFSSWTGCVSVSSTTCTVSLEANLTVTANYTTPVVTTYTLTVDSTNPASGVAIGVSPADNNGSTNGTTSFTRTYNSGSTITLTAPATSGGNNFSSWSGCTSANSMTCTVTLSANTTVTANYTVPVATTYTLTVDSTNPASGVEVTVGDANNNLLYQGTTPFTLTEPAGASFILTAPSTASSNSFSSWTGCATASTGTCDLTISGNTTVTANYVAPITPTVTVTPAETSVATTQTLSVSVAVSGGGNPTPTGSVVLTGGGYTSPAATLVSGSATINIASGSLSAGSDTLTATYTPDSASASLYAKASGTSSALTVVSGSTVQVNLSSTGPAVTNQLLGLNLAAWYPNVENESSIASGFQTAGIKTIRWPGGSWSDLYHWATNTTCTNPPDGTGNVDSAWTENAFDSTVTGNVQNVGTSNFVDGFLKPTGYDLALTADYGTNAACDGPGEPSEAAAWVTAAVKDGITVSHMTVGNEVYGSWEEDLHTVPNDPTTYAAAVGSSSGSGYYAQIKAASPNTLVGVVADADCTSANGCTGSWDSTVLANAAYDFVEYHYYPQNPGGENDTYLVHSAAPNLTTNLNTLKQELVTAGKGSTPIYVGEIGSVSSNPGKQSVSITQGLYAGQVLGELMNAGVSRATWWMGFGNCNGNAGNMSSSLYGWQDFGAYNVFSDGTTGVGGDSTCQGYGSIGTLSPTARAFQLFSNVAVNGENVLTTAVAGDTTDVRAYAATHSGGTALVLFNLNETTSEPVTVTLSSATSSTDVSVITYSKATYDQTQNSVWAAPTTTDLGAQSLPVTITLDPWSMNVVLIK